MRTRLREARRERFMTQLDLAQALGVTEGAIKNWDSGASKPYPRHQKALPEAFGMDIHSLLQSVPEVA